MNGLSIGKHSPRDFLQSYLNNNNFYLVRIKERLADETHAVSTVRSFA